VIEPSDKLLDLIYDAATDDALWTPALIEIADMTGSLGGFLGGLDSKAHRIIFMFNARMSEESHRIHAERHIDNPWSRFMNYCPVGKWVQSDEIISLPDLQRTAFFDEVLRPQSLAHNLMVPLAANDEFLVGLNICRSERQGPYDADELRFFSLLYPHLRRSLLLGFRLNEYKALQRAQFDVLDRLSAGVILLDRAAKVVFANAAAHAMTAYDGLLRLRNSVLSAASQVHSHRLGELVDAAVRGLPVGTMSIPHPHDGRHFTILVSSVRSRDIDHFGGLGMRNVAAMLVIHDPTRRMEIPVEWIMDAFNLTPAEAKVTLCTASGATIPQTAHRLNVSPNTVKTHLRNVFAKTGTNRQMELARLMDSIGLLRGNGSAEDNQRG
jgi:DNA-binding CsgD family transcriptional regulator